MKWFRQKREEQKLKDLQDFFRSLSERMQEFDEGHFFPEQLEPTAIPVYELEQKPWRDGGEDTWCSADILQDPDILEILKNMDEASCREESLAEDILWSPDLQEGDGPEKDYHENPYPSGMVRKCRAKAKVNTQLRGLPQKPISLDDFLSKLEKRNNASSTVFWKKLVWHLDQTGKRDSEIYKKVRISRQTFSKFKKKDYHPSKETVVAMAIGLELDLQQTQELLGTVGYSLHPEDKFDDVIRYCIEEKMYDPITIDIALCFAEQKTMFYEEGDELKEIQKRASMYRRKLKGR